MKFINKKIRYSVGAIIVGSGACALLAGCGGSSETTATTAAGTETTTEATEGSETASGSESAAAVKNISIEVVDKDGNKKEYKEETDAEFLKEAMDDLSEESDFSYSGSESAYGIMVDHVNGQRADYTLDGAYWAIYVNDAYGNNGIESQTVTDGHTYSFRYEKAN